MKLKIDYLMIGAVLLLCLSFSHTSMALFEAMTRTAIGQTSQTLTVIISTLAALAFEAAILIYILEGELKAGRINALATVVLFLCCEKPYTVIPNEVYVAIASTVFAVSLGYNLVVYSELSAKRKVSEKAANTDLTLAQQAQITLQLMVNRLQKEREETLLEIQKLKKANEELADSNNSLKRIDDTRSFIHNELQAAYDELVKATHCGEDGCNYVATLEHHNRRQHGSTTT